jgi:hypothetical protein
MAAVLAVTLATVLFAVVIASARAISVDSQQWLLLFFFAAPVLAMVSVGVLYWKKSNWIASRMMPADPTPVTIQPFTVKDAMVVAFSTVGLVFFLEAVREAVGIVWIAHESSIAASEVLYHSGTWTAIVELALSLWLILGSRGIVAVIQRSRTAGTPQDDNRVDQRDAEM